MKIYPSKEIDKRSGYIVIPFLESYYTSSGIDSSVAKMLGRYMDFDDKYDVMCEKIDQKMQDKLINIATLTIAHNKVGGARKTKKNNNISKTKKNNNTLDGLLQIYLVRINDSSKEDNELFEELRVTGHLIYNLLKNNFVRNCNLMPLLGERDDRSVRTRSMIECILEGMMLSNYKFDKYKTSHALNSKIELQYHLENVYLVNARSITPENLARLDILVQSVFLARDLVNEPANDNRIARYLAVVRGVITKYKIPVELEVLDKKALDKMGMGLILGVAKGSSPENAPCMVVMKYHPSKHQLMSSSKKSSQSGKSGKSGKGNPDWILLGKGITFDTGGLDLKSAKGMLEMKSDLSGAAAVMSFLLGYARCGGDQCIYTVCPFAENSIGARAVKPSDVLKSYDGRTVEVTDTDAEGRLVLADALAYCVKEWPGARLLDMATLTGQEESISGKAFSVVLSTDAAEIETKELIKVSNVINESLVRLPILDKELPKLESNVADIKNVEYKASADIIMSALFMKQFITRDTAWIHIDIAGPAFGASDVVKYTSPEASGVGVRLLMEYFS